MPDADLNAAETDPQALAPMTPPPPPPISLQTSIG